METYTFSWNVVHLIQWYNYSSVSKH